MKRVLLLVFLFLRIKISFAQEYSLINNLIFEKKQYDEAEKILDSISHFNSERDSIYFYKGVILYLKDKKYEEASTYLDKATTINPKSSVYYTWYAKSLRQVAKKGGNIFWQLALSGKLKYSLEKAIEIDSENFEAQFMLATFHMVTPGILGGSQEEAKKIAENYERKDVEKYNIILGLIFLHQRKISEFVDVFYRTNPPVDKNMFDFYRDVFLFASYDKIAEFMRRSSMEEADLEVVKRWSERIISVFPESPYGLWGYGRYFTEKGLYDEAITKFKQAIDIDRNYSSAYYRLGIAYQLKGEKENAINAFETFLSFGSVNSQYAKSARERIKKMKKIN